MTKEILEGNILIATYMGAKIVEQYPDAEFGEHPLMGFDIKDPYPDTSRYHAATTMHYHDDWNWIMPVVKKISDEIGYNLTTALDLLVGNYCGNWRKNTVIDVFESVIYHLKKRN